MSEISISPLVKSIEASVSVPGSKSYANRALVVAALSATPVQLSNVAKNDDVSAMLTALKQLGVSIAEDDDTVTVESSVLTSVPSDATLHCNQSATTLRFLTAVCCLVPGTQTLTGHSSLLRRPIDPLLDALRSMGADIEKTSNGEIVVRSSRFTTQEVTIDVSVSSQFLTALLLIAPVTGLEIHTGENIASRSYYELTKELMKAFSIQFDISPGVIKVSKQSYANPAYVIEPDISSAGYFWALAALCGSRITVLGTTRMTTQGDIELLDVLEKMGATVSENEAGISVEGSDVHAVSVDMSSCPDQIQTIAVLAACADGVSEIRGIETLPHKETDRLTALTAELDKMGVTTDVSSDVLMVHGGKPHGARIETYNDHRMAMSFALAGTKVPGIVIKDPQVVTKTFPAFWETLKKIGVQLS